MFKINQNAAALNKYIGAIKNTLKKEYAEEYAHYKMGNKITEPERPEGLGVMGAQAVRTWINEILTATEIV